MSTRGLRPENYDRERQVLELRRAGASFDDIAIAVGYKSASGAYAACRRAMKRTLTQAGADELRDIELDRLDRLQRAVWPRAVQGDLPAVGTVLRIMERRAKMTGIDAPIEAKVQVENFDMSTIDSEVARLIATLKDRQPPVAALPPVIDAESEEVEPDEDSAL